MKRILVNDMLSALPPPSRTFWNDLQDWFSMEFVGGPYETLAATADPLCDGASLIVRNASYFGRIEAQERVPTIALLQDILTDPAMRSMQKIVYDSTRVMVFNSPYTQSQYPEFSGRVIPLPVDFSLFEPQNAMGCQQALGLPDNCVCWIGACQSAGIVKGWDTFLMIARLNPDLNFVGVFKDAGPQWMPPNVRCYAQVSHGELVKIIGACRVGLCTSRTETQHLAGIEMGACGLPMVVPLVGTYWKREAGQFPGAIYSDAVRDNPQMLSSVIRSVLGNIGRSGGQEMIRDYWKREFDRAVIRKQWADLIAEVET